MIGMHSSSMLHGIHGYGAMHADHGSNASDTKPGLVVSTRPEIRKGCSWDITMRFTAEIINKFGLKTIYVEKPRASSPGRDTFYLCIKVRSKLMQPRRELGFRKVAEVENEIETVELNEHGVAVLKVKFTQRPRSVFHKHSDTMILVVALKSAKDDRVVVSDEHELVFRGGTGSVHSADARKKMILAGEIKKLSDHPSASHSSTHHSTNNTPRVVERPYLDSEESEDGAQSQHVVPAVSSVEIKHQVDSSSDLLAQPQCEPLTAQLFENLRDDYASSSVMNEYKDEMELYHMPWLTGDTSAAMAAFVPGAPDDVLMGAEVSSVEHETIAEDAKFNFDTEEADATSSVLLVEDPAQPPQPDMSDPQPAQPVSVASSSSSVPAYEGMQTRGRKRSMQDRETLAASSSSLPTTEDVTSAPAPKRPKYSLEDRYFQKLFFKSLPFLTLEELRSVCGQAPIPMFVKDEQGVYKWANHIFCAFILDTNIESVINRRPAQFLNAQEGEEVVKSDQYLLQREPGLIQTFNLNVKCQPYKVMKMYTRLRDGNRVLVGAVGQF
eukprot:TRINITY_DN5086_c0_g1_i1.p1 TRINITY_DN5086_c0_g1~~TRINITY_DN5086_c0_g1_i1.p1  ORF type:complete len:553 (+),score=97.81 TRINITY_DN5086_c0_g1_i1:68-1726(+)